MVEVLEPGFYSTIQDKGRFYHRKYGVPVSGFMDAYSSQFANALLGNSADKAVLEMTMTGPTLRFLEPTIIAISGAIMEPKLNNKRIELNTVVKIHSGDILRFGRLKKGFRTYLAVKGGFQTEEVLGSRSFYSPITIKQRIETDDKIVYEPDDYKTSEKYAALKYDFNVIESIVLEVFKGPEYEQLPMGIMKKLDTVFFEVSSSHNRMAYQLAPNLPNKLPSMITGPVLPGTVQLTPSGKLIILMRDCQTTGGYPRVLQLTDTAISMLSQKRTGSAIKFNLKDL